MRPLLTNPARRGIRSPEFASAPLHEKLALLAILALPLQAALTINAGFPLKLSELLLIASIGTAAVQAVRQRRLRWGSWPADRIFVAVLAACLVVATVIALLTANFAQDIRGVHRSVPVDIMLYCGYGLFVLISWEILRHLRFSVLRDVLLQSFWVCAAAVIVQVVGRLLHLRATLETLGFDMVPRGLTLLGVTFPRSGPFVEGQHLGFYAGVILVLALYSGRYATSVGALLCVLYSESTTGYGGVAVAILVLALLRPKRMILIALGTAAAIGGLLIALVPQFRAIVFLQLQKVGLMPATSGNPTKSLDVRSAKAEIGWRMMWDNPWGVGPGRYSAHFADYAHEYPQLPRYLFEGDSRAIVENGYMQIGAEMGVLAFAAMLALLLWSVWRVWRSDMGALAAIVFVAVGFATQSSWTFMPVWAALALTASAIRQTELLQAPAPAPSTLAGGPVRH
ncbi:O-antigen ligase family protein [Microbacterium paludicola]|uniref:O-antigen ligase family protein n=1 Tax=Microbacterium paludicola TaxID=300019 RepID=UPI0031DA2049